MRKNKSNLGMRLSILRFFEDHKYTYFDTAHISKETGVPAKQVTAICRAMDKYYPSRFNINKIIGAKLTIKYCHHTAKDIIDEINYKEAKISLKHGGIK